jgi:hypothetical protein
MFHELLMSSPSSVWRRYGPGPVTFAIVKGTFPWRAELVQSFRVLDAAEDEITNVEGSFLDVAIVIALDTF